MQPRWGFPLLRNMNPDLSYQTCFFPNISRHLNCEYDHAQTLVSEQASDSVAKADVANLFSTYEQLEEPTTGKTLGILILSRFHLPPGLLIQCYRLLVCIDRVIC